MYCPSTLSSVLRIILRRSLSSCLPLTSVKPVNPFGKQHGAPEDSDRHVGDLGNFKTDGQGNAKGTVDDNQVKLIGEQSVLGVGLASFRDKLTIN
jgi:Copper/zinc superoxide dismutase (SODC)